MSSLEANRASEVAPPALVGDANADAWFREAYRELRRIARAHLRQNEHITLLDTTGLVNESYLRFRKMKRLQLRDRGQFLGYAARVMRFVVIDFVRQRRAGRRGGQAIHVTLDADLYEMASLDDEQVLRVHQALEDLARTEPRLVRVIEMRCFAGLDDRAVAAALGVTCRTIGRDWRKARLLLKAVLQ